MIGFDGASLLLQWATGGLLFLWVTTRRREVSLGYGWLMRGVYALMAAGAFLIGVFVIDAVAGARCFVARRGRGRVGGAGGVDPPAGCAVCHGARPTRSDARRGSRP